MSAEARPRIRPESATSAAHHRLAAELFAIPHDQLKAELIATFRSAVSEFHRLNSRMLQALAEARRRKHLADEEALRWSAEKIRQPQLAEETAEYVAGIIQMNHVAAQDSAVEGHRVRREAAKLEDWCGRCLLAAHTKGLIPDSSGHLTKLIQLHALPYTLCRPFPPFPPSPVNLMRALCVAGSAAVKVGDPIEPLDKLHISGQVPFVPLKAFEWCGSRYAGVCEVIADLLGMGDAPPRAGLLPAISGGSQSDLGVTTSPQAEFIPCCGGQLLRRADYSVVRRPDGTEYLLESDGRRGVVRTLVERWEHGEKWVEKDVLLKAAGRTHGDLKDVFKTGGRGKGQRRTVPAWQGLVVLAKHPDGRQWRGRYRLRFPDPGAHPGAECSSAPDRRTE